MLSVMVPALNEELRLRGAVENIVNCAKRSNIDQLEIYIVNDGSTDRTEEVISNLKAQYDFIKSISSSENKGIGVRFLQVVPLVKYERIMIVGGDNNVSPQLLCSLMQNYKRADIVGSYFINSEVRGRLRHACSIIFSLIYFLTFRTPMRYINGNTIYNVSDLKALKLFSKRYSIGAEINVKLMKQNKTFYEVGGYANIDSNSSSALKLKNLIEVVSVYVMLVYEIYFGSKAQYSSCAKRVYDY